MGYVLLLIPLAIIALGVWLVTLIPSPALAIVGALALMAAVIVGVGYCALAIMAEGMRS